MKSNLFLLVLTLALSGCATFKQTPQSTPKEAFHLFLLAGQSNMAGRGEIGPEDIQVHPRVYALSAEGEWVPAIDPIHYDKDAAGVGLGRSFAIAIAAANPNIKIGLIPTACGGSSITSWVPGGYHEQTKSHPYDDAISRSQIAMESGTLKGILWHQGESDSREEKSAAYEERLRVLIERFRDDLETPELPFIIGQLGQFPEKPWGDAKRKVNQAQITLSNDSPLIAFVSSDDLTSKPDNIHFDAESLRTLGKRYAQAYLQILSSTTAER